MEVPPPHPNGRGLCPTSVDDVPIQIGNFPSHIQDMDKVSTLNLHCLMLNHVKSHCLTVKPLNLPWWWNLRVWCWNPHAFMGTNPKPLVLPCFSRQTSAQQGTQQCSQQDRGDEKPWKRHAESWPKGRRRLLSVFVYLLQYTYVLCTYIWSYAYICVCLPLSLLIYLSICLSVCLSI